VCESRSTEIDGPDGQSLALTTSCAQQHVHEFLEVEVGLAHVRYPCRLSAHSLTQVGDLANAEVLHLGALVAGGGGDVAHWVGSEGTVADGQIDHPGEYHAQLSSRPATLSGGVHAVFAAVLDVSKELVEEGHVGFLDLHPSDGRDNHVANLGGVGGKRLRSQRSLRALLAMVASVLEPQVRQRFERVVPADARGGAVCTVDQANLQPLPGRTLGGVEHAHRADTAVNIAYLRSCQPSSVWLFPKDCWTVFSRRDA